MNKPPHDDHPFNSVSMDEFPDLRDLILSMQGVDYVEPPPAEEPDYLKQLAIDLAPDTIITPKSSAKIVEGFVYLVRAIEVDICKIGCTVNVKRRLSSITSSTPYQIELICAIKSVDMYRLEEQLHRMFISKHHRNEWFKLDENDIAYIVGLTKL